MGFNSGFKGLRYYKRRYDVLLLFLHCSRRVLNEMHYELWVDVIWNEAVAFCGIWISYSDVATNSTPCPFIWREQWQDRQTDRHCTYKCSIEALSCNDCCSGKAMSITFKVCKSVHHHTFQINQPTRCNNFSSLLLDVYVQLNMFRASSRPSSGAQQLQ